MRRFELTLSLDDLLAPGIVATARMIGHGGERVLMSSQDMRRMRTTGRSIEDTTVHRATRTQAVSETPGVGHSWHESRKATAADSYKEGS